MSISIVTFRVAANSGSNSLSIGASYTRVAGDFLVAVVGSYRASSGVSAGWTQFVSTGSSGQYLRAAWRIADGTDNDDLTYSFTSSGQSAGAMAGFRSTIGFDATAIDKNQYNVGVTSADTYALAGSLTGVTAGQLPVVIGGESYTAKRALTPGVSGTNWSPTYGSNTFDYGHLAYATNTNTGTIPQPTITFNDTFSSIKFVVGLVLKETTASGIAGGGLFWGQ